MSPRSSLHDEEGLPGPGPSTANSRIKASLGKLSTGGGRRGRRQLSQVLAVVGLITVTGLWFTGLPDTPQWALSSAKWPENHKPQPVPDYDPPIAGDDHIAAADTGRTAVAPPTPAQKLTRPAKPSTAIQKWGLDLDPSTLMKGFRPWPPNPPHDPDDEPLTSLGHLADSVYKLGPLDMEGYAAQMREFVEVAFPVKMAHGLRNRLDDYLADNNTQPWDGIKRVWQTDKDTGLLDSEEVRSWREGQAQNEGWDWELVTDKKADQYVKQALQGSRMELLWNSLPSGIHRSDTLRYLLLLLEGGIYSDTDTKLLKTPMRWGRGVKLWRNGAGWLDDETLTKFGEGGNIETVLPPPSIVVGVEADVGEREDWNDWWPRPMQIVQWTMASAPDHPIALNAMLRIFHGTADAITWAHEHHARVKQLNDEGRYDEAQEMLEATVMHEPGVGGPASIMSWTGPGVWTDAVLSYLRVKYGVQWTDLRKLGEPLRIGDVVVLPVTGFSPGVGQFGSGNFWDAQAMVEHRFRGSWKPKEERKS